MIYVLDNNSLSVILGNYYPDSFPTFWKYFDQAAGDGTVVSVHECKLELEEKFSKEQIQLLLRCNTDFFASPSIEELNVIKNGAAIRA